MTAAWRRRCATATGVALQVETVVNQRAQVGRVITQRVAQQGVSRREGRPGAAALLDAAASTADPTLEDRDLPAFGLDTPAVGHRPVQCGNAGRARSRSPGPSRHARVSPPRAARIAQPEAELGYSTLRPRVIAGWVNDRLGRRRRSRNALRHRTVRGFVPLPPSAVLQPRRAHERVPSSADFLSWC
jgi:hypothetical protein